MPFFDPSTTTFLRHSLLSAIVLVVISGIAFGLDQFHHFLEARHSSWWLLIGVRTLEVFSFIAEGVAFICGLFFTAKVLIRESYLLSKSKNEQKEEKPVETKPRLDDQTQKNEPVGP